MENADLQPSPLPPLASDPVKRAPRAVLRLTPKDHIRTAGEKKFDRVTYTWIGYIANALLSVGAVYAVERTQGGQRRMDAAIEWTQKRFKKLNPDTAKMIATKTFFLIGGFLVMPPIKWLEDSKLKLVKKWDRNLYGEDCEKDPMVAQSHRELEAAPKQNWASVLGSRFLALVPFYLLYGALWDNKSALSKLTNPGLKSMSKDAMKAAEKTDASAFAHKASQGIFFDHPIASASRYIGKKIAQLRGKGDIVARIERAGNEFPGMMTHPKFHEGPTHHDPNHSAVPYYFISEAITSGVVAWGVYALTRLLGPIVGKKPTEPAVSLPIDPAALHPSSPTLAHADRAEAQPHRPLLSPPERHEAAQKKELPVQQASDAPNGKVAHAPRSHVQAADAEHHGAHAHTTSVQHA